MVVKTSDPLWKLFINILTLDTIGPNTKVYVSPLKKDKDAKGDQCHCVDVALHSAMLPQSSKDFDDFFSTVIRIVSKCLYENNAFGVKCKKNNIFPPEIILYFKNNENYKLINFSG